VIEELYETAQAALDRTRETLPTGFPDQIAETIIAAVRNRLNHLPSVQA
jgi:hypothetical protein